VASKIAGFLRRHPVLMVAVLVVAALAAARLGFHPASTWEGPI
jgi:hypothetical protein